jgi:cell division protein FtsW
MNKQLNFSSKQKFDSILLFGFLFLIFFSLVMVSSASISVAERYYVPDFYFVIHHLIYLTISLLGCFLITLIPIKYLQKYSIYCALFGFILLVSVFIPGISRSINGAFRWIFFGPISVQSSEFCKLLFIIYMAGYLVRRKDNVRGNFIDFIAPLILLGLFDILLLLEPDFGAMFILSSTVIGLLFIAGVKLRYLFMLLPVAAIVIITLILTSKYRLQRIMGFLNPWEDQFDKGYQLVQSLIAFGRGGWFGVGLGGSVQKLLYLPEAYTDFIFAIIAEELGFIGAVIVILLLTTVIIRCLKVAQTSMLSKKFFQSYLAYGVSCWIALQSIVNIGVNIGVLPTKGLTLPFISYGGNSLLVCCLAIGIIFRIDYESRGFYKSN